VLCFDRARRPLEDPCVAPRLAGAILSSILFLPAQISSFLVKIWPVGLRLGVSRGFRLCFCRFSDGFGVLGLSSSDLVHKLRH